MNVNQSTHLYRTEAPLGVQFTAQASLTNAAAQNVPVAALATSLTNTTGRLVGRPGVVLTKMRARFVGDAANAGQTITVQLLRNGVAVAAAVIAGLATTAGAQPGSVDFSSSQLELAEGDVLRVIITPSAILTAVVTDITISLS